MKRAGLPALLICFILFIIGTIQGPYTSIKSGYGPKKYEYIEGEAKLKML
jgi:hypothetical protein